MTAKRVKIAHKRKNGLTSVILSVLFTGLIFLSAIFLSDELAKFVSEGLLLSVRVILPSVFPFLIITDATIRFVKFERIAFFRGAFEKLFNINGGALAVFLAGILCGFPIGARLAITLYDSGKISKDECERLMTFSNNASPGYVICAVGMGMRGSVSEGVILYLSMVLSSVAVGIVSGINHTKSDNLSDILWQNYSFAESVKDAVSVSLNICGFVTVFAIISGLFKKLIKSPVLFAIIIPFLEIGNAGVYLSDLHILEERATLILTSFAISFSGLCVAAQTVSLIKENSGISFGRYVPFKLFGGCISAVLTLLFSFLL